MNEYTHYNRIKSVLAEKNKTGTWLSEQMGRNLGTVSRWMTNRSALWDACQSKKVQPSVEQLYDIAKYLDVEVRELLVASKSKE
jgi:transcriptional regulator with XRE-family HTH domain